MRPLISCIMPTMRGRERLAELAIECWASQDYSERELVLVLDEGMASPWLPGGHAYRFVETPGRATIGEKFNAGVVVAPGSTKWNLSAKYDEVWSMIEAKRNALKNGYDHKTGALKVNAAQFADDYYSLINLLRLDLTRRRVEAGDLTGIVAQEIINANFSRSVNLDEFLPYAGAFEAFTGRGGLTTSGVVSVPQPASRPPRMRTERPGGENRCCMGKSS